MTQSVFNLSSILRYRVGSAGVALAHEQQRLAVQQVTTATAISYLAVLEADQAVDAAQSNVQLAETLLTLATSQRDAGVANGIDVARAETRLANQHVQLSQAQTNLDITRLDLLRIVNGVGGQPFASSVTLRDQMSLTAEPDRDANVVVKQALIDRVEVSIAEKELKIAETQRKAAGADLLPSISAFGDYGSSGLKPNHVDYPTRSVGVRLDVPIFNGDRTRSEMKIAASRQRESDAQLRDVRAAVEKDVRQALLNVKTREEQVRAAQQAASLATRELELARDRFKNGVADNIEVVNAQTALENARLVVVSSLAQFNIARLNLASALGHVEDFRL
jgi:outer membrane protein TolC